ncbi:hypothetical protein D9M68_874740 [compost metagenome]
MLGGQIFHRLAAQVAARLAAGHGGEVTGGARVQGQRGFQTILVQRVGVCFQQILEDAALHGQKHLTEQRRVELCELVEHGVVTRGRAAGGLVGAASLRALWRLAAAVAPAACRWAVPGIGFGGSRRCSVGGFGGVRIHGFLHSGGRAKPDIMPAGPL